MVRPIIVDADPLLVFPYSTLRVLTAHGALVCFTLLLLLGQYGSLVYYRTWGCETPDSCVYAGANKTTCERCKDNYLDEYIIYYDAAENREAEVLFFLWYAHLYAFIMLTLAMGLYFFNFFFLGAYLGFRVAHFASGVLNMLKSGDPITYTLTTGYGMIGWPIVYIIEVVLTVNALILIWKFRELRRQGDC